MARISEYIIRNKDDEKNIHRTKKEFKCSFCGENTKRGAFYHGHDIIVICPSCLYEGHMLGILLGDGIADTIRNDSADSAKGFIDHILDKTKIGMYYSLTWSWLLRHQNK